MPRGRERAAAHPQHRREAVGDLAHERLRQRDRVEHAVDHVLQAEDAEREGVE